MANVFFQPSKCEEDVPAPDLLPSHPPIPFPTYTVPYDVSAIEGSGEMGDGPIHFRTNKGVWQEVGEAARLEWSR